MKDFISFQQAFLVDIAIYWQDADSSQNWTTPDGEIMICGGYAGKAHKLMPSSFAFLKVRCAAYPALPVRVPLSSNYVFDKEELQANTEHQVLAWWPRHLCATSKCDSMTTWTKLLLVHGFICFGFSTHSVNHVLYYGKHPVDGWLKGGPLNRINTQYMI